MLMNIIEVYNNTIIILQYITTYVVTAPVWNLYGAHFH